MRRFLLADGMIAGFRNFGLEYIAKEWEKKKLLGNEKSEKKTKTNKSIGRRAITYWKANGFKNTCKNV